LYEQGSEPIPSSLPETRLFAGKERDTGIGFDYFGARYFSAGIRRFTTVDPQLNIDKALSDPQR
jgi:RHS repeat-associated protein